MKPPVLWNRLGSATQITKSVIGENFAWVGSSSYAAGKFGNGSYSNSASNYPQVTNGNNVIPDQGLYAVELWLKTGFDVTNGVGPANNPGIWSLYGAAWSKAQVSFLTGSGLTFAYYWLSSSGYYHLNSTSAAFTWTAGTLVHLAFVINTSGIGGSANTMRVYKDGISRTTSDTALGTPPAAAPVFKLLNGDWTTGQDATIDNIKVYDYDKINFNDRFNERGGMNDSIYF